MSLDLSQAGIVQVPNIGFQHYNVLTHLNLANATVSGIGDNWFAATNDIVDLNLSHNGITTVRRQQFRSLKTLRSLNLMDNLINTIEQLAFQECLQLEYLNLRHNHIRTLIDWGQLSRLRQLDLADNSIAEVCVNNCLLFVLPPFHSKSIHFISDFGDNIPKHGSIECVIDGHE